MNIVGTKLYFNRLREKLPIEWETEIHTSSTETCAHKLICAHKNFYKKKWRVFCSSQLVAKIKQLQDAEYLNV